MRRVLKIFWIIIVAIAILLFAVMIVMQTPAVKPSSPEKWSG